MWIVVPCYHDLGKRYFSRFWDGLLLTCKENDEIREPTKNRWPQTSMDEEFHAEIPR